MSPLNLLSLEETPVRYSTSKSCWSSLCQPLHRSSATGASPRQPLVCLGRMATGKLVFSVLQHKSWELRSETSPPQTVVTHPADSRRGTTGHWACFCRLPCQKPKRSRDPFVMIARSLERMMISCTSRIRVYHPYRYFNPPRALGMHLNLYPVDPADTDWGPSWWYPSERIFKLL